MGHYAKINENKIVVQVIVADADYINSLSDKDSYIKTSYNTNGGKHYVPSDTQNWTVESDDQSKSLRKNYAGIGYTYDATNDVFIAPKPFSKWVLNETTWTWEAPTDMPDDGKQYVWNDNTGAWEEVSE